MGPPKRYYAVARGINPGIYRAWSGTDGAEVQVRGVAGALYKGFATLAEAQQWLANPVLPPRPSHQRRAVPDLSPSPSKAPGQIVVYTDGGCHGNPGPGGYGVVILAGGRRRELAAGFRLTTNNRMELMACIAAIEAADGAGSVVLHTDSRYVVNGIEKGWARRWRSRGWMRTAAEAAENSDLWARLLELSERRPVRFVWLRGHAGEEENERCDALATAAAQGPDLREDRAYAEGRTRRPG
jgi:ribonuclease HI